MKQQMAPKETAVAVIARPDGKTDIVKNKEEDEK